MLINEIIKTAQEKENQTKGSITKYFKSNVLNQAKGLTDFIKLVEEQAQREGVSFSIIGGNVYNVIPYVVTGRGNNIYYEESSEILFKSFVKFLYNGIYFYIEINDNPFFDHFYFKIKPLEDEKGLYYIGYQYSHKCDPLGNLDSHLLYGYNQEARGIIARNLLNIFNNSTYCSTYRGRNTRSKQSGHKSYIDNKIYYGI